MTISKRRAAGWARFFKTIEYSEAFVSKRSYTIDGNCFSTLEEFAAHFSRQVLKNHIWHGSLDAFDDILRGGFGTPDEGFILIWLNSDISRQRLGYDETVRTIEARILKAHPSNLESMTAELSHAKSKHGMSIYDTLVNIINDHGAEGTQPKDGVELHLM